MAASEHSAVSPPQAAAENALQNSVKPRRRHRADVADHLSTPVTNPISAAIALRASLKSALSQTSDLVRALKRHKKQSRLAQAAIDSLKQLQRVA